MAAVGDASLDFSGHSRLAAQTMPQSAMKIEAAEFIGRSAYERRGEAQSAHRNGFKRRKASTGEEAVDLCVPQTRNGPAPFQTAVLGDVSRRW
jgi:transposase-like protein